MLVVERLLASSLMIPIVFRFKIIREFIQLDENRSYNLMERGAWQTTVHGVIKSQT